MDFLTSSGILIDLNAAELERCLTQKVPADAIVTVRDALFAAVKEANLISEGDALVQRRKKWRKVGEAKTGICWDALFDSLVTMDSSFCSHVLCFLNLYFINLVFVCLVVVLLPVCTCVVYAHAGV